MDESSFQALLASIDQNRDSLLADLIEWLRIPSVSSDSRRKADVHAACQWVEKKLSAAGLATETLSTAGFPLVLAETPAVSGAPVVLVYGHYDVQPAEPLEQWISGPFEPTVRGGNLYARGATDDKGQVLTHIQSVCQWLAAGQPLPLQIKFLIEGEEEVGSENLERMLPELAERLGCDCVVISDNSQYADGQPAITYGLRGIATYELTCRGPSQDLHSGSFGGAVMNPGIALCHVLSKMVDTQGVIQLPGYYDKVEPLTEDQRAQWRGLPQSDDAFASGVGVSELFGETGYTTDERRWGRPTFDINGLTCGHQGEGAKTIIPAVASAKISFRLVPHQDPQELTDQLKQHIEATISPGITWELHADHGAPGMLADIETPFAKAAEDAIESAFGTPPVFIREGGSIPIVTQFQKVLGCDCLLLGWGLSDDNAHSPNEKFRVDDYFRGIRASCNIVERDCPTFRLTPDSPIMLDRKFILQNLDLVRENCERRGVPCDVQRIAELDALRLAKLQEAQELNRQANETNKKIKGASNDERPALIAQGKELRGLKDAAQKACDQYDAEIVAIESQIPNLTHPDAPSGGEDDAKELARGATAIREFDFEPLDHLQLGDRHDLFDFEGGARVAGSGFYFLRNAAVRLDLALQQFAISYLSERGFTPVSTPDLALTSILQGTGFNPRGPETQIYSIENTELNLVATAEITLGGMMADQILSDAQLPIKYCGLSHCFRTEAGAAGRASKGLYRVHQFTKVEMFAFTLPDQSDATHEQMRQLECELFDALEIPYRVIDTASGDLGGPAYRKYDLEAWMPGRADSGAWGEVTSTSNCTDYQARRLNVRYKTAGEKGTQFVHTLNGTAVATGRAIIALIENHQRADGSIAIPKSLQPWMGCDVID